MAKQRPGRWLRVGIEQVLNPITDGAVLPVLHLNGYKINNPTLLARISHEELESLFRRLRETRVLCGRE